jgi:hypothetical protein
VPCTTQRCHPADGQTNRYSALHTERAAEGVTKTLASPEQTSGRGSRGSGSLPGGGGLHRLSPAAASCCSWTGRGWQRQEKERAQSFRVFKSSTDSERNVLVFTVVRLICEQSSIAPHPPHHPTHTHRRARAHTHTHTRRWRETHHTDRTSATSAPNVDHRAVRAEAAGSLIV